MKQGKRTTRPGSRSDTISRLVLRHTDVTGQGLKLVGIARAYEAETGIQAPASLGAEVGSLVRRGILVRAGGRPGHTVFAHRDSAPVLQDAVDDVILVLRALRSVSRRRARPVTTREVSAELERLGLKLQATHANAVRTCLQTLSRPRTRGPNAWRGRKAVAIRTRSSAGVQTVLWRPVRSTHHARGGVVRSMADAVRTLVDLATPRLGFAINPAELQLFARVEPDVPAAHTLRPSELRGLLRDVARADARYPGSNRRRLTAHATVATCHGGPDTRYGLGDQSLEQTAAAELGDALTQIRPAREIASLQALDIQIERLGLDSLRPVAQARRTAFANAVATFCPNSVETGMALYRSGLAELSSWVDRADLTEDQRRIWHDRLRQAVDGLNAIGFADPVPNRSNVMCVGTAGLASHENLEPFMQAARGLVHARPTFLVEHARRFPRRTTRPADRFGDARGNPLSDLDRVDALLSIFEGLAPAPVRDLLLRSAAGILGHVLRDAEALRASLGITHTADPFPRRALVVALALLGESVAPDEAGCEWNDPGDVATHCFAAVLVDPSGATERVRELYLCSSGVARDRVAEPSLTQLEAGRILNVLG
jgi:hypothetical protein